MILEIEKPIMISLYFFLEISESVSQGSDFFDSYS